MNILTRKQPEGGLLRFVNFASTLTAVEDDLTMNQNLAFKADQQKPVGNQLATNIDGLPPFNMVAHPQIGSSQPFTTEAPERMWWNKASSAPTTNPAGFYITSKRLQLLCAQR